MRLCKSQWRYCKLMGFLQVLLLLITLLIYCVRFLLLNVRRSKTNGAARSAVLGTQVRSFLNLYVELMVAQRV